MTPDLAALVKELTNPGGTGPAWNLCRKAKAAIETLAAENAALRTLLDTYNLGGWTDSLSILQRAERAETAFDLTKKICLKLEAERDALRQDAERYRWLRDPPQGFHEWLSVCGPEECFHGEVLDGRVDAAIDAARVQEGK